MRLAAVRLLLTFLAVASFAQVVTDSARLRALFGSPIKKNAASFTEVFAVRPGMEVTATYSAGSSNLCELEIPSGVAGKQEVERVLEQAAPVSMRGNKWNEMIMYTGVSGFTNTYYKWVLVSREVFTSYALNKNPGAYVFSKEKRCGWKPDVFDTPPERKRK